MYSEDGDRISWGLYDSNDQQKSGSGKGLSEDDRAAVKVTAYEIMNG